MAEVIISGITRDITIGAASGTGLTSGGTYTGINWSQYSLEIDSMGTPDTFKWRENEGVWTENVAITGSAQTLNKGVTATFAATTGHTTGDSWTITVQGDIEVDRSVTDNQLVYYYSPSDYHATTIILRELVYNMQTGEATITADTFDGEAVTITSSDELYSSLSSLITDEQADLVVDLDGQDNSSTFPDNPVDME